MRKNLQFITVHFIFQQTSELQIMQAATSNFSVPTYQPGYIILKDKRHSYQFANTIKASDQI